MGDERQNVIDVMQMFRRGGALDMPTSLEGVEGEFNSVEMGCGGRPADAVLCQNEERRPQ